MKFLFAFTLALLFILLPSSPLFAGETNPLTSFKLESKLPLASAWVLVFENSGPETGQPRRIEAIVEQVGKTDQWLVKAVLPNHAQSAAAFALTFSSNGNPLLVPGPFLNLALSNNNTEVGKFSCSESALSERFNSYLNLSDKTLETILAIKKKEIRNLEVEVDTLLHGEFMKEIFKQGEELGLETELTFAKEIDYNEIAARLTAIETIKSGTVPASR